MLRITTVGWATSIFFVISYVLWVIAGLTIMGSAFWPTMAWHLFGLRFAPTTGFFVQLIAWFLCGWYVGLVFVPIYNAFARITR